MISGDPIKGPTGLETSAMLVSINGISTRQLVLSPQPIEDWFYGPLNSKVTFDILTSSGQPLKLILTRTKLENDRARLKPGTEFQQLDDLVETYPFTKMPACAPTNRSSLLSEAVVRRAFESAANKNVTNSLFKFGAECNLVQFLDSIGRKKEADRHVRQATKHFNEASELHFADWQAASNFARHLNLTGRISEAEMIYKRLVEVEKPYDRFPDTSFSYLESGPLLDYAKLLADEGRHDEAVALCDRLGKFTSAGQEFEVSEYAHCGRIDDAISILSKEIKWTLERGMTAQRHGDLDQPLAGLLYNLAVLQESQNKISDALNSIKQARAIYENNLDPQQIDSLEKLALSFPRFSDLEFKESQLLSQSGNKAKAMKTAEDARNRVNFMGAFKLPPTALTVSDDAELITQLREQAVKLTDFHGIDRSYQSNKIKEFEIFFDECEKVRSGSGDETTSSISKLSDLLRKDERSIKYHYEQPDYWSALCDACKTLIDRKESAEARSLINALLNDQYHQDFEKIQLLADKTLFSEQLGCNAQEAVTALTAVLNDKGQPGGTHIPSSDERSESLRKLAVFYMANGDISAAEKLLAKAGELISSSKTILPVNCRGLIYMDKALLAMAAKEPTVKAQAIFDKSYEQPISTDPRLGWKILSFSDQYSRRGDAKSAERVIRSGIEHLQTGSEPNSWAPQSSVLPELYWRLVDILLSTGKINDARAIASTLGRPDAQQKASRQFLYVNYEWSPVARIAAKLDETRDDHRMAAKDYSSAVALNSANRSDIPGLELFEEEMLRSAVQEANNEPNFDTTEKGKLLYRLGQLLPPAQGDEQLKLFKQALEILPADATERVGINNEIASMSQMNGSRDDEFNSRKKAAEDAERNGIWEAYRDWANLADSEFYAGNVQDALEHYDHAVQLYKTTGTSKDNNFRPIIYSFRSSNSSLPLKLNPDQLDKLEHLLGESASITSKSFGDTSLEYAEELMGFARLYAFRNDEPRCASIVNDVFKIRAATHDDPRHVHSQWSELTYAPIDCCELLAQHGSVDHAIALANFEIVLEDKLLSVDSPDKIQTLRELGELYLKSKNYQAAEPYLEQALDLEHKFQGDSRVYITAAAEYGSVLRHLGRQSEADRITTFTPPPYQTDKQEQIRQQGVDPVELRMKKDPALLDLYQRQYDEEKSKAHYGGLQSLQQLATACVDLEKFARAKQCYLQLDEVYERTGLGDPVANRLALSGVCLKLGDFFGADQWMKRAKQAGLPSKFPRDYIVIAKQELAIGSTTDAKADLEAAQAMVEASNDSNKQFTLNEIGQIWRSIGESAKADGISEDPRAHFRRVIAELNRVSRAPTNSDKQARLDQIQLNKSPIAAMKAENDPLAPFMADLDRRIRRAWLPPSGTSGKGLLVMFRVNQDGRMYNLRLDHSSGLAAADRAGLKAVEDAAPFRPLPAERGSIEVHYIFDAALPNRATWQ